MPKSYISVRVALSDFTPSQDEADKQLEVKKGQMLLLLDTHTSRRGWWKFTTKTNRQQKEGVSGLLPKENTQEVECISLATACTDFVGNLDGDLMIKEHESLSVYHIEGDWVLVKGQAAVRPVGYVPRGCIKLEEEMDRAIAFLDFEATEPEELSFNKGETLIVLDCENEDWWRCKGSNQQVGLCPRDHIELQNAPGSLAVGATEVGAGPASGQESLISGQMSISTIMSCLVAHGCKDLSYGINSSTFSDYPFAPGRYNDVYRGQLFDGTIVALKSPRLAGSSRGLKNRLRALYLEQMSSSKRSPSTRINIVSEQYWIGVALDVGGESAYVLGKDPGGGPYKHVHQDLRGLVIPTRDWYRKIHGDVKPKNILVSGEGIPLLSNFENARSKDLVQVLTPTKIKLTLALHHIQYASPELINNDDRIPNMSSDVYALGMTMYEVMIGKSPYNREDLMVLLYSIMDGRPPIRPEKFLVGGQDTDKIWELFLRCCSYEPASRPSAKEVTEAMMIIETLSSLSRKMDAQGVVSRLVAHGCDDLTGSLKLESFGDYPVAHGGLSDIYRGQILDGATVAVKVLRVSIDSVTLGSKHLKASRLTHAARELHTWSKCKHPNIMPLLGLSVFRDRIGMVAPWMENGNLSKYLKKVPGANRYDLCAQICEGLAYLHQNDVVHCDLKGANVLVSDEGKPLLTDFGTSLVSDRTLRFTATTGGPSYTLRWSAAEILQETSLHTKASDVYALGMTIYETMAGVVPYHGRNDTRVMLQVINKEFPERPESMPIDDRRSDTLWELLVRCWAYEPEARPSAAEVTGAMRDMAWRSVMIVATP